MPDGFGKFLFPIITLFFSDATRNFYYNDILMNNNSISYECIAWLLSPPGLNRKEFTILKHWKPKKKKKEKKIDDLYIVFISFISIICDYEK